MPRTIEARRADLEANPRLAPPISETVNLEILRGITAVRDSISRSTIKKANAAVGKQLDKSLKANLKLTKMLYGSVSKVFSVFKGLKSIVGGI